MIWSIRAYKALGPDEERAERGIVRLHHDLSVSDLEVGSALFTRLQTMLPVTWKLEPLTLQAEDPEASNAAVERLNHVPASELPNAHTIRGLHRDHQRILGVIRDFEPRVTLLEEIREVIRCSKTSLRYDYFTLETCGAIHAGYAPGARRPVRWVSSCCLPAGDEEILLELTRKTA